MEKLLITLEELFKAQAELSDICERKDNNSFWKGALFAINFTRERFKELKTEKN